MTYDFNPLKKKVKDIEEWLKKELAQVRTGRAAAALLDGVTIEAYGSRMPLNQVGSLSTEDARTLRLTLWDQAVVKDAEKSIIAANLGVSVSVDDKGIRIFFPELTSERRTMLTKLAREKLEQAKVSLRKARDEVWNDIQAREKQGGMGEDEKFRFKDQMEKIIQDAGKILDDLNQMKEKEITS